MKAILPVGGTGKKLLPLTAVTLKPLLPVGRRTALDHIMQEVSASGCRDVAFVLKHRADDIRDYIESNGSPLYDDMRIELIMQGDGWGMGDAIACAESYAGNDRCAVILGDDILRSDVPGLRQMSDSFPKGSVLGCMHVPEREACRYGIVTPSDGFRASDVIEKPQHHIGDGIAVTGRYIMEPSMFSYLQDVLKTNPTASLTEAFGLAARSGDNVQWKMLEGTRYDIGSMDGYLRAFTDAARQGW